MPDAWMRPFPLTCFAAAWIILGDVGVVLTTHPGRHMTEHMRWNRTLLLVLLIALFVWQVHRYVVRAGTAHAAGLSLAALGLAGRALSELAVSPVSVWPPVGYPADGAAVQIVDATRWLGLAAFFVGLTLFAVEVVGTWVDRRALRT